MSDAIWVIIAGLVLAALVPLFMWVAKTIAKAIVDLIEEQIEYPFKAEQVEQLMTDVDFIKGELTMNGGFTVKDQLVELQRTVREMQRDLELLFSD